MGKMKESVSLSIYNCPWVNPTYLTIWVQLWCVSAPWCMWFDSVMHQWAGVIEKQTLISHGNAWKCPTKSLLLKIAISQHALLQTNFCDKSFYFKGLVIHNEIIWSKVCPLDILDCNSTDKTIFSKSDKRAHLWSLWQKDFLSYFGQIVY